MLPFRPLGINGAVISNGPRTTLSEVAFIVFGTICHQKVGNEMGASIGMAMWGIAFILYFSRQRASLDGICWYSHILNL